jgi:hypothetical protein
MLDHAAVERSRARNSKGRYPGARLGYGPPMPEPPGRIAHERIEEIHAREGHGHVVLGARARWTAVIIAVLAAVLAIADLSAHRATKTIITTQAEVGAIGTRYEATDNHRTTLENDGLLLDALGDRDQGPAASKAREDAKALAAREAAQLGAEERALEKKQHALQEKVEHADDRYSNLEIGIGALQIAIVLASVSIVAAATWLLGAGVLAGAIGFAYVAYAIAAT